MSENGFHLAGLLRSLQAESTGIIITLVVIFILYFLFRRGVSSSEMHDDEKKTTLGAGNWVLRIALLLVLVTFMITGFSRTVTNRIPRSDVDKSGVYQQMDSQKTSH